MADTKYYTTRDISLLTNKFIPAILKYARTNPNIKTKGVGKQKRYLWTEKNLEEYKIWLSEIKEQKCERKYKRKETTKIDTLYKRLNRAIKRNDNILANEIRKDIEIFKKNNKLCSM